MLPAMNRKGQGASTNWHDASFSELMNVSGNLYSNAKTMDGQILDFTDAANSSFKTAIIAGNILVLYESIVKSFHKGLKEKMKIIRKLRPIGNEFKIVCDEYTQIVLHFELHEGDQYMQNKEFVNYFGATTATCLRLNNRWKGSGRVVVADSWFGSVNSAIEPSNINSLHSMLVKAAHKIYPKNLLGFPRQGEWNAANRQL